MTLYGAEAIAISTILSDASVQLKVLENIFSSSLQNSRDNTATTDSKQRSAHDLINRHNEYQLYFEKIIQLNSISKQQDGDKKSQNQPNKECSAVNDLKESSKDLAEERLKDKYILRISQTCGSLHKIFKDTSQEIEEKGTFISLIDAVKNRKVAQEKVENAHIKEEELKKTSKGLRKKIDSTIKSHEQAVKERKELIAHLKDQLQELKAKALMERKYKENICKVALDKVKAECDEREKRLKEEIRLNNVKIEEEKRATFETTAWIQTRMCDLQAIENMWSERSENDISSLQHKLEVLKKSREKDLETLSKLTEKYEQYKQTVIEERIKEEEIKKQLELEERNLLSIRIIQNWWRTVMVRKQLGPYSKKKGRKGKKGAKKGKK